MLRIGQQYGRPVENRPAQYGWKLRSTFCCVLWIIVLDSSPLPSPLNNILHKNDEVRTRFQTRRYRICSKRISNIPRTIHNTGTRRPMKTHSLLGDWNELDIVCVGFTEWWACAQWVNGSSILISIIYKERNGYRWGGEYVQWTTPFDGKSRATEKEKKNRNIKKRMDWNERIDGDDVQKMCTIK